MWFVFLLGLVLIDEFLLFFLVGVVAEGRNQGMLLKEDSGGFGAFLVRNTW
jgi:hypothetical protein